MQTSVGPACLACSRSQLIKDLGTSFPLYTFVLFLISLSCSSLTLFVLLLPPPRDWERGGGIEQQRFTYTHCPPMTVLPSYSHTHSLSVSSCLPWELLAGFSIIVAPLFCLPLKQQQQQQRYRHTDRPPPPPQSETSRRRRHSIQNRSASAAAAAASGNQDPIVFAKTTPGWSNCLLLILLCGHDTLLHTRTRIRIHRKEREREKPFTCYKWTLTEAKGARLHSRARQQRQHTHTHTYYNNNIHPYAPAIMTDSYKIRRQQQQT